MTRLVAARPLAVRRRIVQALFLASVLLRRAPRAGLERLFERVLRIPRREAARLDRRAAMLDVMAEIEWVALLLRTRAGVMSDLAAVAIPGDDAIARLAATGRPVILAPLHMGAYVATMAAIMLRFFPGRPLLILRRRDDMPLETRVMERIREFGVDMRFLNVSDRKDYLAAIRFARKGAVIVAFCDLPPSYGIPAPMPMFGLDTSFAFGLDGIARLTDAAVLPVASRSTVRGEDVRFGVPFQVEDDGAGGRARAAEHIRRHIRETLSETPEQWHLWSTLPNYLPSPDTVAVEARDARAEEFAAEAR